MREALEAAGYEDIPKNGLYVIGALAYSEINVSLARIIDDLKLSKQASGQLVDTLVTRGYLDRMIDPSDRRRLIVSLSERGRDAARIQTEASKNIDEALRQRSNDAGFSMLRQTLAALIEMKHTSGKTGRALADNAKVRSVTPILFVREVRQSAAFFTDRLGFTVDFLYGGPPYYGSVSREGACLHLRHVARPNFTELAAREDSLIVATVEVCDIQAIHAEFVSRQAPITRGIVNQSWGGTDFHVRDPDGNEISFVQYKFPNR